MDKSLKKDRLAQITCMLFFISIFGACNDQYHRDQQLEVYSPNQKLKLSLDLSDEGKLHYSIYKMENNQSKQVIESSPLGIVLDDQKFDSLLVFSDSTDLKTKEETYNMMSGKRLTNHYTVSGQKFKFKNKEGAPLYIEVKMFDEGFGFRYILPRNSDEKYLVKEELTTFNMPRPGKAWIEPYDTLGKWSPAYEVGYENEISIGSSSPKTTGWAFPALFFLEDTWCLITESNLDTNYVGSHLDAEVKGGKYRLEFPYDFENYGMGNPFPEGKGKIVTPWRVGIVGDELKIIVESNLVHHLSRPSQIEDTSWIKPGKVSWSWWGDMSSPLYASRIKEYIDFSAKMGWEYTLVDLGWHNMEEGNIKDVINYANNKDVGVFLWYNSAGDHTRVDAGPSDRLHKQELREKEFSKLEDWGVKGVKVDFFQSDKQQMMKYYDDLAMDAAEYHLLLNTHGSTIPRGWPRAYPNFLTMDAVKGAEHYPTEEFSKQAPVLNTILPFTRSVIGPMDYTPVTFSNRGDAFSIDPSRAEANLEVKRRTTNAHELALSVIFESGLQHFADRPQSYLSQPEYVIQFLKDVPVVWDDTYFIKGYPGEFTVMAREKNDTFFIAGINGVNRSRQFQFELNFLSQENYSLELIMDGANERSFNKENFSKKHGDTVEVDVLPYGGFAGKITLKE